MSVEYSSVSYLEHSAQVYPNKIAIRHGNDELTYQKLRQNALRINSLISEKIRNKPIAILLPKGCHFIVAMMGVLYSKNFYTPIDVKLPEKRIEMILKDLDPELIITSNDYLPKLSLAHASKMILWDQVSYGEDENVSYTDFTDFCNSDPAYCIYTSGSTGDPKGVVISHYSLQNFISWVSETFEVNNNTIFGNQSPFQFDVSVLDIYTSIKHGATLDIIPENLFSYPPKLMEYVVNHKINFIIWVPSVLIHVANVVNLETIKTKLNFILFAGEVMPNRQLNIWRKCFPKALFANLYGPTEATVIASYYLVKKEFPDHEPLPIGIPCSNTKLLILKNDQLITKKNEIGELYISGPSLALGYWKDFTRTSQCFFQNPIQKNFPERIYKTGDLCYWDNEGNIMYVGRTDNQIKHMGYRIDLGDIENCASTLDSISHCCSLYNNKSKEIALIFTSPQNNLDCIKLRKQLLGLLPKYMTPSIYHQLDIIPTNANGKIDRKLLSQRLLGEL